MIFGVVAGTASLFFLVAAIVFLFKNRSKAKSYFALSAFGFLAMVIAAVNDDTVVVPSKKPTPVVTAAEDKTAKSEENRSRDIELLGNFHRLIVEIERPISGAASDLEKAGKVGDRFAMYESADRMYKICQSGAMRISETPELSDKKADELVKQAYQTFKAMLLDKQIMADRTRDVLDEGDFRPSKLADIKRMGESASAKSMTLAVGLFSAYEALGVDIKSIDTENGGLLKSSK